MNDNCSPRRRPTTSGKSSLTGTFSSKERKLHNNSSSRPLVYKIGSKLLKCCWWLAVVFVAFCLMMSARLSSHKQRRVRRTNRLASTTTAMDMDMDATPFYRTPSDQKRFEPMTPQHHNNDWYPLGTTAAPYSDMTPQMDVVWARGWYNAVPPPPSVPLDYYNRAGLSGGPTSSYLLEQHYFPSTLCGPRWMRVDDVAEWIRLVLPDMKCEFTLITGDGISNVPEGVRDYEELLESPYLTAWYAQNVVGEESDTFHKKKLHPKLHPIPVGLPIHYGFPGSPHSLKTLQTLLSIRQSMPAFRNRSRKILFDPGTVRSGIRAMARLEAKQALRTCPDRVEIMTPTPTVETWQNQYSTHQFGVVVRGTGWDTYRTWEFLLLGTVPILLEDTPMVDHLHWPAHVPIVTVQNWTAICSWTDEEYDRMVDRYEGWIANAHHWLRPSLWVPRNQTEMERLCDVSPGCRQETTQELSSSQQRSLAEDVDNEDIRHSSSNQDLQQPPNTIHHKRQGFVKKIKPEESEGLAANNNVLDLLSPRDHEDLLRALLHTATAEELERIIVQDPIAKEKMYQQLLMSSQSDTYPPTYTDFERCLEKCEEMRSETIPCTINQRAVDFSCNQQSDNDWSITARNSD